MSAQKVVLLACGSFNPPTNMHLRMFELARDYLQRNGKYNVIAGIMSPVSDGYNKKDLATSRHRCEMVKLALRSSKWIRLDTWESEQPVWSETAKVLSHHRVALNNQANTAIKCTPSKKRRKDRKNEDVIDRCNENSPHRSNKEENESVQLKLLCGGDLLESFSVPGLWKEEDIEDIVKSYGLVCITRNGSDPRKFIYESDVLTRNQDNIHIVTEWIQNEISSTKIRRALRRNESVKYLIQDTVIDYIREHGLYGVTRDNKYIEKATPSPQYDVMDYIDGNQPLEISIDTSELMPSNPVKFMQENGDIDVPRSPRRLQDLGRPRSPRLGPESPKRAPGSPKVMLGSGSPRRFLDEDDGSNSPKSPQPNACLAPDIGNIVRRVRNVRVGFTPETRVFAYTATETCV